MHAQLQQVFINQVLTLLQATEEDKKHFHSQMVVSTHSSHVLYERGFKPIRYFRRGTEARRQETEVVNLAGFYQKTAAPERDFLARYLKLTHCDIFFSDAAILVEGNVERLLVPLMMDKVAKRLSSCYLSVLEVGGAFGHRFQSLIECLGIVTLVITDIDSCFPPYVDAEGKTRRGAKCLVKEPNAVTSNETLKKWLPLKETITELQGASPEDRTQLPSATSQASVYVVYQTQTIVSWGTQGVAKAEDMDACWASITGRTLEEAFALQNLEWCQDDLRKDLRLRIRDRADMSVIELTDAIGKKVAADTFKKTDFALALMHLEEEEWVVPDYIRDGLQWLETKIAPPEIQITIPEAILEEAAL